MASKQSKNKTNYGTIFKRTKQVPTSPSVRLFIGSDEEKQSVPAHS